MLTISHQTFMKNKDFVGREFEVKRILEAANAPDAAILIIYGRRRVGKTELIEQTLRQRNLLKLEGVESGDTQAQMRRVLYQLSKALGDPYISNLQFSTWLELFDFIGDKLGDGQWTLYLEELQWLAEYEEALISDLKYVWDNKFRHNPKLLIVLCGSSPSFMRNKVVHSKALYNRSTYELNLQGFSIAEAKAFLPKRSNREVMNAYLAVGGIPEYLKRIKKHSSIQLGICKESFEKDSYFSNEHTKIFISSLATNVHYKEVVNYLSHVKFATKQDIEKHLKTKGGGNLTDVLTDLKQCGFIDKYTPLQVGDNSNLVRYCIADNYLRFYFKFIRPIEDKIEKGHYNTDPMQALNKTSYATWMGFAFERFCCRNDKLIAAIIGFSAVRYKSGVFFNRNTNKVDRGYQIDLVFDRADHVFTVCEIRYQEKKVGADVIDEVEEKIRLMPNHQDKTIEKVLIAANGASDSVVDRFYFDRIITLDDIFEIAK